MSLLRLLVKNALRASLMAQRLRICLPMQETRVWSLVWEDPTCCRATKPVHHNYWACALEPGSCNYWAPVPLKPVRPRAHPLQQEEPLQWEVHALQLESSPHSLQLEKARAAMKTQHSQKQNIIHKIIF